MCVCVCVCVWVGGWVAVGVGVWVWVGAVWVGGCEPLVHTSSPVIGFYTSNSCL